MIDIDRLIWDKFNRKHISRHGVTKEEVEQACESNPYYVETPNGRLRAIGLTHEGRILTVILAFTSPGAYYPVTARPASKAERELWRQKKGGEAE